MGQCEDITSRLARHNRGGVPSTKSYKPWLLIYTEKFPTRSLAVRRESEIKGMKSRKYIEELIKRNGQTRPD